MESTPEIHVTVIADHGTVSNVQQNVHIFPSRPESSRFQAPIPPPSFVPRSDVEAQIIEAFDARVQAVVLHGMGGSGKSTMAAAIARDPQVRARFPDGTMWATLGQEPDVGALLLGWIQEVGDYGFLSNSVDAMQARLRSLLRDRAMLLVIDNAWDPQAASTFLAGGEKSCALITTRRMDVSERLGETVAVRQIAVGPMTPAQGLALLSARLGRELGADERDARKYHACRYPRSTPAAPRRYTRFCSSSRSSKLSRSAPPKALTIETSNLWRAVSMIG